MSGADRLRKMAKPRRPNAAEPPVTDPAAPVQDGMGLAEVLAGHNMITGHTNYQGRGSGYVCVCGKVETGVHGPTHVELHSAHVAAEIQTWLKGRLAAAEVVEAAESAMQTAMLGLPRPTIYEEAARAALAAVADVVGQA